jgi:hypothetical protein
MRHIVDRRGEWGIIGASSTEGSFIPARSDLGSAVCLDPGSTQEANVVRVRLCNEVRNALADGTWRFDASDLMPGAIGSFDASGGRGALRQGLIEYVRRGADGLDEILAEIDTAWPATG